MLRTWWRQALVVVLFLMIAACSGGGCSSGCASCGVTPLAGGFPQQSLIPNAAAVRMTRPGLDFIQGNLAALAGKLTGSSGGVIQFQIPTSNGSVTGATYTICPDGPKPSAVPPTCVAEIGIGKANLKIDTVKSFDPGGGKAVVNEPGVLITGTIPLRVQDLPFHMSLIGLNFNPNIGVGTGDCSTGYPTHGGGIPGFDYKDFPVTIFLPLVTETLSPREGYTKIDTKNAIINPQIQASDVAICEDCTIVPIIGQPICNAVFGAIESAVFNTLVGGVIGQLTGVLNTAFCTNSNPALNPPCPTGSHPDYPDGGAPAPAEAGTDAGAPPTYRCVFDSDPTQCVPTELGLDGHINLSALLKSISPGTTGALDFILASGGDMDPAPDGDAGANGHTTNGLTLGMLGGALQQPQSECVPAAPNPLPTGLGIPDELKGDKLPNWTSDAGPDLGIAIHGKFLSYAMGSVYNSGLLCLGVSTENFQQLNTGLVSFLIPSVKPLTFEQKGAAIAVATRPQKLPVVTLGGGTDVNADPLLGIFLPSFAVDFYIWSTDRYIRAFTYTADLTIPINLQTGKDPKTNPNGGLLPSIGNLGIANGVVTNADLMTDNPVTVAGALSQILSGMIGQLLGNGFSPINLSSALGSLGLTMDIPAGGIRKLSKGNDAWLAIFANLGVAPPGPIAMQIDTSARLVDKTVHPEAMQLSTVRPDLAPSLHVTFASPDDDGSRAVEYSWRIDQGTWSAWSPERDVVIRDPMLYMQAKHALEVSARLTGRPQTQDATPASVPFTIDVLAPFVKVVEKSGARSIEAWDVVSPSESLVARTRGTDASGVIGAWSAWTPVADAAIDPALTAIDVEVRDEEGNVGSVSSALIRGRPDPTIGVAGGCGSCAAGAHTRTEWPAVLLGLAAIAALFARRRRDGTSSMRARAASAALALGSIATVAASSQGCACGSDGGAAAQGTGCGNDCNQVCNSSLPLGLVGAYTSVAKAKDGTIWVAGYNDAAIDPNDGVDALYGDLVVGKYDVGRQAVQWVTVDGLPPALSDGTCPSNDPHGWRGGLLDSGPDVGLWTSIQVDGAGHPMVSYYDATDQALKFASSQDGVKWATHTIFAFPGADIGRYSKMVLGADGKPVVAFMILEKGDNGHSRSKVTLAHGNVATPAGPSDWALETALEDDNGPCRAADCDLGSACLTTTNVCTPMVDGCNPACATGTSCVTTTVTATGDGGTTSTTAPACVKSAAAGDIHPYPSSVGDYISLAMTPSGPAMVVYDRIHGNLLGLTNAGGHWAVTILDGETGSRANGTAVDTGDDGVGASLFVAANGDWHVSYVNGITETLQYLFVPGGALSNGLVPQKVDDGSKVDGNPFADNKHVVGDDSVVRGNDDGSVTITYQDATAGVLRVATGATTGNKWDLHAIAQPAHFGGFFPHFIPGDTTIANWWRAVDPSSHAVFGDVAILAP